MKNTKFFFKCILALLPIIVTVLYTTLIPYGYMDKEYPAWKYSKDATKEVGNFSTVILGDSRAMADLIPEKIDSESKVTSGQSTVNLAFGGASSIEMYYTLNRYLKNNATPDKVIIMFAPFHYSLIDNYWTRTAYFNYLSIPETYELFAYAKASNSETLLTKGYKNDLLSYRMRFPDKYLPALINSKFILRYNVNEAEYNRISSNYGYSEFGTENGCDYLNFETSYDRMHTSGDAVLLDIYLNRLLKLCVNNDISTIVSIPPMNEASFNALNDSYVEDFTSYMNGLKSKYPDITIDSEIPCFNNSYFGDSSHLNRNGAEKFTSEFISKYLK